MLPVPPAQVQTLPAPAPKALPGRDIAFPGFNGFPLRGTLLDASGSPYVALLVQDSGPLDRDWRGPRLSSHGGRTLAEWLRDQGIASLRFDKRVSVSKDPRLDTSLDAQAGDLKAALTALRAQPEAHGRKILLVGHGEGALLSLVASQQADAILLLAMPAQTMAQSLVTQISPQLPAEKAAANLAYLQGVFNAIRDGRPTPAPGPDVYPALAKLCRGLMAPETLEFVRATLDLDPWAMASRTAVPLALAWGDRDVQSWKPSPVPSAFRGTILEIRQANHLFKRELRTRGELNGASALSGYGDEVPLADLAPIAAWLKGLP